MKKIILLAILILALFIAGCADSAPDLPESPAPTESASLIEGDAAASSSPTPQQKPEEEPEITPAEDEPDELDSYIASLKESADAIQTSLEKDILTQAEMNEKSAQLYELWDDALNYLWGELRSALPEEEFSKLLDEQLIWIADKEAAVEETAKEFEGGSMYALIANGEAAKITEERVYEFYYILKDLA